MMTMNSQYSAASLYDGGWRAEDRDQMIDEYGLTADEADEICKELADLKGRKEMDLAGELDEMIALGWTEEEAKDDPEAFLDRIGEEYKEGLTEEDIWRVWANVIEGRDVNEIKFIVKRTETYEGKDMVTYRQESGFFEKSKDTALRYSSYEDAEYAVELERDDPKYDKSFMGECKFEIEEV